MKHLENGEEYPQFCTHIAIPNTIHLYVDDFFFLNLNLLWLFAWRHSLATGVCLNHAQKTASVKEWIMSVAVAFSKYY